MANRFKPKRYFLFRIIKIAIVITIVYFGFIKTFTYLYNTRLKNTLNSQEFLNYLLHTSTNKLLGESELLKLVSNFNLNTPRTIVASSFNDYFNLDDAVFEDIDEEGEKLEVGDDKSTYFEDPNRVEVTSPLVYIYNSHQSETYATNNLLEYNIKPSVLMASYILKEKLNDLGVKTIVEEQNITEILRVNNWKYKYSYAASRILLDDIKEKEPSIKYFIDIHRDSSKREKTITTIDNTTYARVLFVVGLEHENYEPNLKMATELNKRFISKEKSISRGIYKKSGKGVNGIYNQDISPNAILLELGGQYNTIEEVNNTINLLSPIIADYIKEVEGIAN